MKNSNVDFKSPSNFVLPSNAENVLVLVQDEDDDYTIILVFKNGEYWYRDSSLSDFTAKDFVVNDYKNLAVIDYN